MMDAEERERLAALETGFRGLKKSVDMLRSEGKEGRALLRQELTEYVRHERYIWTERIVIGIISGFIGFGVSSLVAS